MAANATIFKAELQIADVDRGYYHDHSLTLARHPSETDERMMVRLLAFARHAHEDLAFTKGISTEDEPDLWRRSLTGDIELWIDLGQPDEKRFKKACGRSAEVWVYAYGGRSAPVWWAQIKDKLTRFDNLTVANVQTESVKALGQLAQRSMRLQCTIQDGQVWIGDGARSVQVEIETWMAPR